MSAQNPILIAETRPHSRTWAIKAICAHCMGCTMESPDPVFQMQSATVRPEAAHYTGTAPMSIPRHLLRLPAVAIG
jgi:hypothetical protein